MNAQPTGVPRPIITQDNSFFFEAAAEGRLEVQRCADCHVLRHPPAPCCAECQSFEWDTVTCSGRGSLYSYVIAHRPQDSAFEYPHAIALVDLEEGVRIVADVFETDHARLQEGTSMEVVIRPHVHGTPLPSVRERKEGSA